ncbi:TFIIB-type zinc ribbon-containing protein [Thermocladium modestius]|uniref:TFIIB-type zinc ribbon-containing protein n=1 Tax=Thermocladium modestius TaxID=62609 RepID=UPI0016632120|nr:TFIIB-type zinc ribbon-containing protein [Thermocladium modestius]
MKQVEEIKCQVCGSTDVIYDGERGELICSKCGTVIEERPIIDMGAEWRDFGDKPSRARAQAIDETQPNLGIGILRIGKIMGKRYSISFNRKIEAITRTSSIERNVVTIRHVVKQLLIKLSLPSYILPNVIRDYRKLAERGYRARLRETAVALTYLNCKKEGIPCRLKTLVKMSGIDGHGLNRVITKIRQAGYDKLQSNGSDVMKYVTALVNGIDTGPISKKNVYSFVMDLLNKAHEKRLLNGKSNYSVAAAAVYIAMMIFGIRTKQRDVASIASVTDVTIRSRYRELMEKIEIEIII